MKPVHNKSNNVEMIINKMIKIGFELITPSELITEIPAGTKNNPMLFVSAVPTVSTCPNFTMPVHKAMKSNTKPTTEPGIGTGEMPSITLEISKMIPRTVTWCKKV